VYIWIHESTSIESHNNNNHNYQRIVVCIFSTERREGPTSLSSTPNRLLQQSDIKRGSYYCDIIYNLAKLYSKRTTIPPSHPIEQPSNDSTPHGVSCALPHQFEAHPHPSPIHHQLRRSDKHPFPISATHPPKKITTHSPLSKRPKFAAPRTHHPHPPDDKAQNPVPDPVPHNLPTPPPAADAQ